MYSFQFQAHPKKPRSQRYHTNAVCKPNFNQILQPNVSSAECTTFQYKRKHHNILQSQCITNTNTVRQQLCGSLVLFLSIADCNQNFRSAYLINCDQSDSTKYLMLRICFSA